VNKVGLGVLLFLLLLTASPAFAEVTDTAPIISAIASSDDSITVVYSGAPGNSTDWIGLYSADAPNQSWLASRYLDGRQSGALTFDLPRESGHYVFRLFANDSYQLLASSNRLTVGTADPTPVPAVPIAMRAVSSRGRVFISWSRPTDPTVIGFNLFRGLRSGEENSRPLTDSPIAGTYYTDFTVDEGLTYCYLVRPVYFGGSEGQPSNEACVMMPPAISPNLMEQQNPRTTTIVLQIENPYMTVNWESKEIDPGRGTAPLIVNDRTLLPLRALVEAVGGTVNWNQELQQATVQTKYSTVRLWPDRPEAWANGARHSLPVPPQLVHDRMLLPLRFVAEQLGFEIAWEESTRTITLTYHS